MEWFKGTAFEKLLKDPCPVPELTVLRELLELCDNTLIVSVEHMVSGDTVKPFMWFIHNDLNIWVWLLPVLSK